MTVAQLVKALGGQTERSDGDRSVDFMCNDYALIGEPLNLLDGGQQWFARVYESELMPAASTAVVLGATPWLARLVSLTHRRTIVADVSPRMLESARTTLLKSSVHTSQFEFLETDWRTMPPFAEPVDMVVADNSFSFLPYPEGWRMLADALAARMRPEGRLIMRVLSAAGGHRARSADELVSEFMNRSSINYTEVRAALLFSKWSPETCAIETQKVLETFRTQRASFDRLFARFGSTGDNDLLTVRKYEGVQAVYYAPPIERILATIGEAFRVTAVRFGPYAMSEYFPLIVAVRN